MKTFCRSIIPSVAAAFHLFAGHCSAQVISVAHNFNSSADGGYISSPVIASGNVLYGVTFDGGPLQYGTVFGINNDGTGFTNLHSFPAISGTLGTNAEGAFPSGRLALSDGVLYGVTGNGGTGGVGSVFRVNINGLAFTNLHSFSSATSPNYTNADGASPSGGMVTAGGRLYGTAGTGGTGGWGTIFAINPDGTGFMNLHNFGLGNDGISPSADLTVYDNMVYGTTSSGNDYIGIIFGFNTNGTGYTNIYGFGATDGYSPYGGVILSGNTLYGTTYGSDSTENGMVYRINTDGSSFTNLHGFTASFSGINGDGANPNGNLILAGNTVYGTTPYGGPTGNGTVFSVKTDGTQFGVLHDFSAVPSSGSRTNADGANSVAGLVLSGTNLYGTTRSGGPFASGVLFSFPIPSYLTVSSSTTNVVLTWPTNTVPFSLQSTTNLVSNAIWSAVSPSPVVINGQNTVTNGAVGKLKYYRLTQ